MNSEELASTTTNTRPARRGLDRSCRSERDLLRMSRREERASRKSSTFNRSSTTKSRSPTVNQRLSKTVGGDEKTTRVSSPRRRSFTKRRNSSSSASKVLLSESANGDNNTTEEEKDSVEDLSSLKDRIQMASSLHYSRHKKDVARRTSRNMNSSFSNHDSGSSRHSLSACRRHTRPGRRHRSSRGSPKDDTIRILQFDCTLPDGLAFLEANNVHSERSKNSHVDNLALVIKEESLTDATTDIQSLESSFASCLAVEEAYNTEETGSNTTGEDCDESPLIPEDNDEAEGVSPKRITTAVVMRDTFNAFSKMLATPRVRRQAIRVDNLDLACHFEAPL